MFWSWTLGLDLLIPVGKSALGKVTMSLSDIHSKLNQMRFTPCRGFRGARTVAINCTASANSARAPRRYQECRATSSAENKVGCSSVLGSRIERPGIRSEGYCILAALVHARVLFHHYIQMPSRPGATVRAASSPARGRHPICVSPIAIDRSLHL
jgi:hypothetical protein